MKLSFERGFLVPKVEDQNQNHIFYFWGGVKLKVQTRVMHLDFSLQQEGVLFKSIFGNKSSKLHH